MLKVKKILDESKLAWRAQSSSRMLPVLKSAFSKIPNAFIAKS